MPNLSKYNGRVAELSSAVKVACSLMYIKHQMFFVCILFLDGEEYITATLPLANFLAFIFLCAKERMLLQNSYPLKHSYLQELLCTFFYFTLRKLVCARRVTVNVCVCVWSELPFGHTTFAEGILGQEQ